MSEKVEVRKIDIQIGDKTISLKPEEAKELKQILNEMFKTEVIHHHHHDVVRERYWWSYSTPMWTFNCYTLASSPNAGNVMLSLNQS